VRKEEIKQKCILMMTFSNAQYWVWRVWIGFMWLRIWTSDGLLWTQWWTFGKPVLMFNLEEPNCILTVFVRSVPTSNVYQSSWIVLVNNVCLHNLTQW
jgi:hypothetical protein